MGAAADMRPGEVVAGRYEIVRQLGAGGMGAVFEARQLSMERKVALKLIHAHIAARPDVAARFHREMKATSRITHANTIQVHDYGATDDGRLFLAMEYLEGEPLSALLEREGALPPQRLLHIGKQITRALDAAHQEGIAHRDLKPDNVMLVARYGERDLVKVLDFGIARFVEGEGAVDAHATAEGALLGTPAYMSPEQALGKPIDYRTDFYSLGVVLFQLATGKLPFEAPTLAGFLVAHASEAPPAPSSLAPVPARLEALILRLLAKSPDERPTTASEVLRLLEDTEAQLAAIADATATSTASGMALPALAPRRRHPWAAIGGAILVGGALAAGAVGLRRGTPPVDRAALDAVLGQEGDPAAPPSCRAADAALVTRERDAAERLKGAVIGQARPQDREALALLSPEPADAPAEYWALVARARLVVDAGPDGAREAAARAIARCPGYALASNVLGNAEKRARRFPEAEAAYRRAIADAPDYIAPRFNLGLLALAQKDGAAASAAFDEVLKRQPSHPRAHLARGQAELLLGQPAAAVADLEEATARLRNEPQAFLLLGDARRAAGVAAEATRAYCEAKRLGADVGGACP